MSNKSKVYFIKLNEIEKIRELLPEFNDKLGIKVHFGEEGNKTYVPAKMIKPIVEMTNNPTLIETCTLYKGPRMKASTHKQLAIKHGFDFAPIDILDGEEGDDVLVAFIGGQHFKTSFLGADLSKYASLLVISHFKGHGASGFGGAIKNLGMGLSSRMGKLAQHASIKHDVKLDKCVSCGSCIEYCPVEAISFNSDKKAEINQKICISCSKCIAVCPRGAIRIPWDSTGSQTLQERIAEYAFAATRHRQCFYVNFLVNIVPECDCIDFTVEKMTDDIGILVSADPVAIDQASYDLVVKQCGEFKRFDGKWQLAHAEKMGLGVRKYELINHE